MLDSEAPEILNCPQTIYAYTDKMSQTASVTWQTPTATDNSGTVTVSQTKGAAPGSSFQLGLTEIRYKAIDANGNQSPECIFFVNVEGIFINSYPQFVWFFGCCFFCTLPFV